MAKKNKAKTTPKQKTALLAIGKFAATVLAGCLGNLLSHIIIERLF